MPTGKPPAPDRPGRAAPLRERSLKLGRRWKAPCGEAGAGFPEAVRWPGSWPKNAGDAYPGGYPSCPPYDPQLGRRLPWPNGNVADADIGNLPAIRRRNLGRSRYGPSRGPPRLASRFLARPLLGAALWPPPSPRVAAARRSADPDLGRR